MKSILSTKKLSNSQKQLFLNSGLSLVEYNAIVTETTNFKLPSEKIENAIFTSKNAVNAVLEKVQNLRLDNQSPFDPTHLEFFDERLDQNL